MKWFKTLAVFTGCLFLAVSARAQTTTNVPLTKLENLETHTQTILIRGVTQIGSLTVNAGVISVRAKETTEVTTGKRLDGISIEIAEKEKMERTVVDYDELDELLSGMDYVSKVDYAISPMPSFEAVYTTRAGLRVVAYSSRRSESIQTFLQSANSSRIYLAPDQLAQLRTLIEQAKTNLDKIREQK